MDLKRNFWCEVDLDKITRNIEKIRKSTRKKLMAVVKGNAYGLGLEEITRFLDPWVDSFAVSYLEEAHQVKSARDILIMTPDLRTMDLETVNDNYILTLDDYKELCRLVCSNRIFRVHIYLDTGMNRFGIQPVHLDKFMEDSVRFSKNIKIEGIYTHLHNTGNRKYTLNQIQLFRTYVEKYKNQPYQIHLLNSMGFARYNTYCDFDDTIRVGSILYGHKGEPQGYIKVFCHKAVPMNEYMVAKGRNIGYGNLYTTKKSLRVGVLDIGYIDKFYCPETIFDTKVFNLLGSLYHKQRYRKSITYEGKPVKIMGSVNMNSTLIDMGEIPEGATLDIDISSVAVDSSIPKKYLNRISQGTSQGASH